MDNPDTPEPHWSDRGQVFWRLIPMIFFGIVAYLALWLIFVLALIQFVTVVAAERPNGQLGGFARRLIRYVGEIFGYLMFHTDTMPFPFDEFPEAETSSAETASAGAKSGDLSSSKASTNPGQSTAAKSGGSKAATSAQKSTQKSASTSKSQKSGGAAKESASSKAGGGQTKKSGQGKTDSPNTASEEDSTG